MELLKDFPEDVVESIKVGMKEPARYYEALKVFHGKHGCTVRPLPIEYTDTFDAVFGPNGNTTVSSAPILNNWFSIDRLHKVKAITLVVNGRGDIGKIMFALLFFTR